MNDANPPATSPIVFLQGKKVILRPIEEQDHPSLQRWVNDERVLRLIGQYRPTSARAEREFCERADKAAEEILFAITTRDGELIGDTHIFRLDRQNRRAETGTLIGPEYWGKGYGVDAKMLLLKFAFDSLNLHKMTSGTLEYNERSLKHLLRCGYQIEGRQRRHLFKDGRYWDHLVLGVFREEWWPCYEAYQKEN